jgi:hypothetical protein
MKGQFTEQEIKELAEKAFPINHGPWQAGSPAYDSNENERKAFVAGFKFRQWIEDVTFAHDTPIPLHIRYKMYLNQQMAKFKDLTK